MLRTQIWKAVRPICIIALELLIVGGGGGGLAFAVKGDMSLPVPAVRLGWLTPARQ